MHLLRIVIVFVFFSPLLAQREDNSVEQGAANVYPSQHAAVAAMVDQFVSVLRRTNQFDPNHTRITVSEMSSALSGLEPDSANGSYQMNDESGEQSTEMTDAAMHDVIEETVAKLHRALPNARIVDGAAIDAPAIGQVVIGISLAEVVQVEHREPATRGYMGRMKGILFAGNGRHPFATRFDSKPWADDWESFIKAQPQEAWIVGRSGDVCRSEVEALGSARANAAAQLMPLAKAILAKQGVHIHDDLVRNSVIHALRSGGGRDEFAQRMDDTSGESWRAAVLVSTRQDSIAAMLAQLGVNANKSSTIGPFAELGLLAIVIVVLYWFLKGVTRGYAGGYVSNIVCWPPRPRKLVCFLISAGLFVYVALMLVGVRQTVVVPAVQQKAMLGAQQAMAQAQAQMAKAQAQAQAEMTKAQAQATAAMAESKKASDESR